MNLIHKVYIIILYLSINSLFLFKYGSRQHFINPLYLTIVFILGYITFFYLFDEIKLRLKSYQIIYIFLVVLFFAVTIWINISIDDKQLNVDRWSAMNVFISSILDGKYPYSVLDHLNQGSSNLPGLFIIGLPFYLLGNVGFLQSFTFLLFAYVLQKTIVNIKARLFGLLMLIFSASYLWEIYVKSDLMSNFIILMGFGALMIKKEKFKSPIFLGGISSLLFLTRLISIIPLTLILFKDFLRYHLKNQLLFLASAILTVIILSYLVLMNCPSFEVFKNNNPITLQNNFLPTIISFGTIIIPFFYTYKISTLNNLIGYSVIFLSIPIIISFTLSLYNYGLQNSLYNSFFDISYFNIITPFIIYFLVIEYDNFLKDKEVKNLLS